MAITKSAKKALRQARARRVLTRAQVSALRTAIKQVRAAGDGTLALHAFRRAERVLDRAARKGLIHRNRAARQKTRLARVVREKGGAL